MPSFNSLLLLFPYRLHFSHHLFLFMLAFTLYHSLHIDIICATVLG